MKDLEIKSRILINPTDLDRRMMNRAKNQADRSRCDRSRFGCIIYSDTTHDLVAGHNEPCNLSWGLCGDHICLRRGVQSEGGRKRRNNKTEIYQTGEQLGISCVHAEMSTVFKFLIAGLRGPATMYLYGDSGWSLPCVSCLKNLIYVGVRKFWLAGRHDVRYECDVEIPKQWLETIEFGFIPAKMLER